MLSSVLNSERAVAVNIQIMRLFTQIRQMLSDNTELRLEIASVKQAIEKLNRQQDGQNKNIELVFQYLDELNDKIKHPPLSPEREPVGYKIGNQKDKI